MMGSQCSRQGQLSDFGDPTFKRLGPEGESLPLHNSHNGCFNTDVVTREKVAFLLKDLSKLSAPSSTIEKKVLNISNESMKESKLDDRSTIVGFPAEGETSEKQFVELPKDEKSCYDSSSTTNSSVFLPKYKNIDLVDLTGHHSPNISRSQSMNFQTLQKNRNLSNFNKKYRQSHNLRNADNFNCTYTLYNFEGKSLTTKQDLCDLMESICDVVGKSVYSNESNGNSPSRLKVHLKIDRETCSCKCDIKSPSKYTLARNYNGMVFPPPNSEEAEKVSSYIEEKLSTYKEKTFEEKFCPLEKNKTVYNETSCRQHTSRIQRRDPNSERKHSMTDVHNSRSKVKNHTKPVNKSSPQKTPSFSAFEDNFSDTFSNDDVIKDDIDKYRLKHRCTYHRKFRNRNKHINASRFEQVSDIYKQNKTKVKSFHNSDYDSHGSNTSMPSTESESDVSTRHHERKSSESRYQKVKNSFGKYRERPSVWPGQSYEEDNDSYKDKSELCICKRMLGQDHPCDHSSKFHKHYKQSVDVKT